MRYLPLNESDRSEMLAAIGAASIEELFADVHPSVLLDKPIEGLPLHASEMAVERHMEALASRNMAAGQGPFFLGAGAYRHHVPALVDHLIQRGEFLTAYTPYQPEIAQGTLQMLFEFQSQVARLYGCEIANASMYDGSTATWEAVTMARRITKRDKALLADGLHPHYAANIRTMARFTRDRIVHSAPSLDPDCGLDALAASIDEETSCIVVQYPDVLGRLPDLAVVAEAAHAKGALLVAVVTEPVTLGALATPGELGADIVVGEGQSLGVGLQFGGPYLGLFACREKHVRHMPGRLCGQTTDVEGKPGYVLTLSTREQHIRREKATSNICTNSGLCALAFSIHMTLLGDKGLTALAAENHRLAIMAADRLAALDGVRLVNDTFFNEFCIELPVDARPVVRELAEEGVLAGVALSRLFPGAPQLASGLLVAVTETTTPEDIEMLARGLEEKLA
ncbi:aminomethyl-transferring glycine dehydrogenase subunit GcvPA [Aurantiacibacter poecillastricola]|uniref:aminomethyl-transferring glycine dehydrogenase subunit GcvPA n=1 Tax=Aurantiacibacter poecillastricola TaxID=3064385 RepID=UPI00273D045C|nr:aminomethyl-transferring glycine dehydrogenase subunit GcvPA [Aurantiacibacter sp. 219JJ12-13]MDP5262406.1 aminomethyl-transferring glycine dehydrogenase subunit GcvPA [Aurantiacibacter sp. 219JJ12-13]